MHDCKSSYFYYNRKVHVFIMDFIFNLEMQWFEFHFSCTNYRSLLPYVSLFQCEKVVFVRWRNKMEYYKGTSLSVQPITLFKSLFPRSIYKSFIGMISYYSLRPKFNNSSEDYWSYVKAKYLHETYCLDNC